MYDSNSLTGQIGCSYIIIVRTRLCWSDLSYHGEVYKYAPAALFLHPSFSSSYQGTSPFLSTHYIQVSLNHRFPVRVPKHPFAANIAMSKPHGHRSDNKDKVPSRRPQDVDKRQDVDKPIQNPLPYTRERCKCHDENKGWRQCFNVRILNIEKARSVYGSKLKQRGKDLQKYANLLNGGATTVENMREYEAAQFKYWRENAWQEAAIQAEKDKFDRHWPKYGPHGFDYKMEEIHYPKREVNARRR